MPKQKDATPHWVRITLRMTPEQRESLRRAAEVSGKSLSAFVLNSACGAAEHLLRDQAPEVGHKIPNAQTRAAMEEAQAMLPGGSYLSSEPTPGVESLPAFTNPARQCWESIPVDVRERLLANVWCGHCGHEVTITHFSGTMKGRDLLLVGRCAECQSEVARVIEGS